MWKINPTRIYAILLRHTFLTMHQMERTFDLFLYPIMGILLWGFISEYSTVLSSGPTTFLVGGLILWVVFERVGTSVGVDFMYDVWEKCIMNILASPLKMHEYIFGVVLVAIVKVFLSFIAMWLLAALMFGFNIGSLGSILVLMWINIVIFAVSLGIFNISLVLRFGSNVGPLTWILPFLLQPFSAVFYPVSVLPPILQKIASALPLTYVFEGLRFALETGKLRTSDFYTAIILNVVYFILSVCFFAYIFGLVKKKGSLVKLQ